MRILDWNVENTHDPKKVEAKLDELVGRYQPDVITLQETYHDRPALKRLAERLEYRLIQYKHHRGSERAETAMLVSKKLKMRKRRAIRLHLRWKGPKAGIWHTGRVYRWALVKKHGRWHKIVSVHQPFGQEAKAESIAAIQRWFDRAPDKRPVLAVGDWNMVAETVRKRLDGVHVTGYKIDLCASRNVKVTTHVRGKHGSDHNVIIFNVSLD